MHFTFGILEAGALRRLAAASLRLAFAPPAVPVATPSSAPLREFAQSLLDLARSRDALEASSEHTSIAVGTGPARAVSASPLWFTGEATPTVLRSTEEINTVPTSYSTAEPSFVGSSSAEARIGGIYSGAQGDTVLSFRATGPALETEGIGSHVAVHFEVTDAEGNLVDEFDAGLDSPTEPHVLSNGLEVSFTSNDIEIGDSFDLQVFASVGSQVAPDHSFDGLWDSAPHFDPGLAVQAGSFDVNGVTIAVNADDTLDEVLDRISASTAGVAASFDASTETVVMTQATDGPDAPILLEQDTSGLLAALKLDGATAVPGTTGDSDAPLGSLPAFSGVQSGSFTVDGVTLAVDVLTDSLEDVLTLINGSVPGVHASFDTSSGKVVLQSTDGSPLDLENATSGLFSGLNVAEGHYTSSPRGSRAKFRRPARLTRDLESFSDAYERVFSGEFEGEGAGAVKLIRSRIDKVVAGAYDAELGLKGNGTLTSGLGLDLEEGEGSFRVLAFDAAELRNAIRREPADLVALLFGTQQNAGAGGLLATLDRTLEEAQESLTLIPGFGLDVLA